MSKAKELSTKVDELRIEDFKVQIRKAIGEIEGAADMNIGKLFSKVREVLGITEDRIASELALQAFHAVLKEASIASLGSTPNPAIGVVTPHGAKKLKPKSGVKKKKKRKKKK